MFSQSISFTAVRLPRFTEIKSSLTVTFAPNFSRISRIPESFCKDGKSRPFTLTLPHIAPSDKKNAAPDQSPSVLILSGAFKFPPVILYPPFISEISAPNFLRI